MLQKYKKFPVLSSIINLFLRFCIRFFLNIIDKFENYEL